MLEITYKKYLAGLCGAVLVTGTACSEESKGEKVADAESAVAAEKVTFERTDLTGVGQESKVMRRDPSDVIKVGDLFYIWYSKGPISPGYDATLWYATSTDGLKWEEKGMALPKGEAGSWEAGSVFTPNILVADGKYYLFYTGTSKEYKRGFNPDSKIGVAVSDSPDGPWVRGDANPVITNSSNAADFDSHLIDDACLIKREGKYWLYYKGRQLGKTPSDTQMGVAIAEKPEGPYVKSEANPVIPGNHEVVIWPHGTGVAALIGKVGPKDIIHTVQYSEDGLTFNKEVVKTDGEVWAAGTYRPEAFTDSGKGTFPTWGVEIAKAKKALPFIGRFDVNWPAEVTK